MPLDKNKKFSLIHKEYASCIKTITSSQEVPESTFLPASLTLEAALIFPLFLFLLIGILFFFRILQTSQITDEALAATGSWLAVEVEEPTLAKAVAYFQKKLTESHCPADYIVGGQLGVGFTEVKLTGEYIDLKIRYYCQLPVTMFGLRKIPLTQRVRIKRWTGDNSDTGQDPFDTEEQFVYVTPNGTAYHLSKECSYLQLAIEIIGKQDSGIVEYTPCNLCGNETGIYPYYYVTQEGSRYHTKLDCSGLKRTIYMVALSEVNGRSACNRCGGE